MTRPDRGCASKNHIRVWSCAWKWYEFGLKRQVTRCCSHDRNKPYPGHTRQYLHLDSWLPIARVRFSYGFAFFSSQSYSKAFPVRKLGWRAGRTRNVLSVGSTALSHPDHLTRGFFFSPTATRSQISKRGVRIKRFQTVLNMCTALSPKTEITQLESLRETLVADFFLSPWHERHVWHCLKI